MSIIFFFIFSLPHSPILLPALPYFLAMEFKPIYTLQTPEDIAELQVLNLSPDTLRMCCFLRIPTGFNLQSGWRVRSPEYGTHLRGHRVIKGCQRCYMGTRLGSQM